MTYRLSFVLCLFPDSRDFFLFAMQSFFFLLSFANNIKYKRTANVRNIGQLSTYHLSIRGQSFFFLLHFLFESLAFFCSPIGVQLKLADFDERSLHLFGFERLHVQNFGRFCFEDCRVSNVVVTFLKAQDVKKLGVCGFKRFDLHC